jgi:hypothetical protein
MKASRHALKIGNLLGLKTPWSIPPDRRSLGLFRYPKDSRRRAHDFSGNESRSPLIVSAEADMSDHQREIYHSENGDRWLLCSDDDGFVFVLHKANASSGGSATKIELGDFLGRGKAGPEHQALARLVGSLVDKD